MWRRASDNKIFKIGKRYGSLDSKYPITQFGHLVWTYLPDESNIDFEDYEFEVGTDGLWSHYDFPTYFICEY